MTVVISNREEEGLPHCSEEKIYHPPFSKRISSIIKRPDDIRLMHAEQDGNIHCCILCLIIMTAVNYYIINTSVSVYECDYQYSKVHSLILL